MRKFHSAYMSIYDTQIKEGMGGCVSEHGDTSSGRAFKGLSEVNLVMTGSDITMGITCLVTNYCKETQRRRTVVVSVSTWYTPGLSSVYVIVFHQKSLQS